MFATVDPQTRAISDVSPERGENRFPVETPGEPPHDVSRQRAIPGPLYFDEPSGTVRRSYVIADMTPMELAERKGSHALKVLSVSDQAMVRSLEDAVLALCRINNVTLAGLNLHPKAEERFRKRAQFRRVING